MKFVFAAALCIQLLASGCAVRMSDTQKGERLAIERGRLVDLVDPVAKTKSYIAITNILLEFAEDSARDGDSEALQILMTQYSSTVRSAREYVVDSPPATRNLIAALQQHARRLNELRTLVSAADRPGVDAAISVVKVSVGI